MSTALEDQVAEAEAEFQGEGETETVDDVAETAEPTPPMQIPLEGFTENVSMQPGGDRAKTATINLRGGRLPVSGEFKKGDVIEFYVRARVSEVHFVDTVDRFGEITGTERKHVAKPIAVTRMTAAES